MARAGGRAGKVFSSGRLSLPVRPAACKRRTAVRKASTTSVDSGYSLCSTDSEDQVLFINRGLDRCAALLHDILQCEGKESPLKTHRMPFTRGSVRSSTMKTKKTSVRKPTTASHVYKEKGLLRRTLPPGQCNAEVQRPGLSSPPLIVPSHNLDHVTTQMQHLNQVSPLTYMAPSAAGPEASALYNCRLPTSTPTLSPQHPANPKSSSNEGFHQTLPPGGVAHFPSSMPASSAFTMAGNTQTSAVHNSTVPTGYQPMHHTKLRHYESLIRDSDLLHCVATHLAGLQQGEIPLQSQAAESGCESDAGAVPAREIRCQTSFNKCQKSPEKTEKKIMAVKYLLGEIKSLVEDQAGDGEATRLVAELERTVSLLPAVVGSTNVNAEIALALQPLRSENAQLRRRLRILNQQLRDRERSARTEEQNAEVTSLQSMNETLQHQLSESQKALESLQSKNEELLKVIEVQKEESRKTATIIQEREQQIVHISQENGVTTANGKKEVEDALGKMKSAQLKLEASEKENQILGITLRQRDAEITRLRELTRTLQAGMAKLLCDLGKDTPKPKPGSSLTQAALGSYDRQVQSEQCPASTSIMNYLRRLETDQVFTDSIYSDKSLLPPGGQVSCSKGEPSDDYMVGKSLVPKSARPPVTTYSPHKPKQDLGSELCYLTSDEHRPDETMYLPLASSPCRDKYAPSLRGMCTPPEVSTDERDLDSISQYNGHSSDKNPRLHKDSRCTARTSDRTSKAHQQDSRMEVPPPRIPSQSYPPPVLQQMRRLQVQGDPPSDHSVFESKPDWSLCSFSTFTSHDEQDFRHGLAALDANIAKLQRTLQNGGTEK
ncbi:coiled-coil domain-containing protein 14 [Bufo gargarizans]|uniref:coiled-coil domain-containing protein 14 n=1 Tax=Bufo gargarizans TaxID=30331 RepID=UPI001CF42926|nr:coiled-coil domain-containing protein 14 [Bufo gargarizans]